MPSRIAVVSLYAATMALAGFLLFQVQPVLAKFILPWFGGSATTWIVCMLFFQMALLAGYAHAYAVTRPFRVPAQAKVQIAIIALSLLLLPITPSESWKPGEGSDPTWRIVLLLAASVGVPYMVLATTSPLLSRWLARIDATLDPSRFFAASNLGSFVGLLSYPFVFERVMSSEQQTFLWSIAYVVYGVLFAGCAVLALRAKDEVAAQAVAADRASTDRPVLWLVYSMLGSVLLLASTNAITQWSAVIPFLWIAPLSLYLLTFVIAFGHQRLYARIPFVLIFLALSVAALWSPSPDSGREMIEQVALHCGVVFFGCMICHGEMVRLQPAPARLPKFYLTISAGGALGGVLVALVAPVTLHDYFEHPAVLLAIGLAGAILIARTNVAPMLRYGAAGLAALMLAGAAAGAIQQELDPEYELIERVRNFYGVVKISQEDEDEPRHQIVMTQAGVEQGSQWQAPALKLRPYCSFDETSGVGLAIFQNARRRADPNALVRIGIIGLGAGMLAAHGRPGDVIRYYEINPAVKDLTERYFTFLKEGKATTDVLLGDGRLVLERQLKQGEPQNFDVLVIDAFRGAAPPMHLMTQEAFDIYTKHLAPHGVIAINFEMNTFEMAPLHRGMAKLFGMEVGWVETKPRRDLDCTEPVSWALYSKDTALFEAPALKASLSPWRDRDTTSGLVWTDRSSNLMSILNWSSQ